MKKFHFLVVGVVLFSLFSPVREWCASDHHMPLLCCRFSSVAPDAALPAHLTVCKATAPDGAVNPSAATPAACFPLWTFRGLKRPQHGAAVQGKMYQPQNFLPQASKTFASAPGQLPRAVAVAAPSERSTAGRNPEEVDGRRGFRPSGGATGRPGDLIQQKETFS